MKLLNLFKNFKKDESGAVTVDWVVLTGAVVALGIAIGGTVTTAITGEATEITSELRAAN